MKTPAKIMPLLLLVCALPFTTRAQFTFTTNNGAITITGYTGTNPVVVIPSTTNGYPVTGIGSSGIGGMVFPLADSPTSVTIPTSITNIGNGVFNLCLGLTNITVDAGNPDFASVTGVLFNAATTLLIHYPAGLMAGSYVIPGSVTNIGSDAFISARQMTNVDIPSSVISIGPFAFNASGLTSVTVPNGVASIGSGAFSLVSAAYVTIGNGVTNIGAGAFSECFSLRNIAVDAANPDYASVGGVLFDKTMTTLIQYPSGLTASSYAITNSVANIGGGAFANSLLTEIIIPNSVTNIGSFAFQDCSSLTNIAVAAGNPSFASTNGVLFNEAMTLLIQCPAGFGDGSYAIPGSVTSIGDFAFEYCLGLTSVTIGNSVTNVGSNAFALSGLHEAYFQGDAPLVDGEAGSADTSVFYGDSGTAFYQPGTTDWGTTFGGWPVRAGSYQAQPQILGSGGGLGVQSNGFQFTISWATNTTVVVETSTNLQNWTPVATNTLVNGTNTFVDATWSNYPSRFYRIRSP
jgi:BspA type Leucine rich repeat region (6 copies)